MPMDGPCIGNGAVRVEAERVAEVGTAQEVRPRAGEEVLDLGEQVLMPGLINAHCHLDYSALKYAISPMRSFTDWVIRLNSIKRQLSAEDILASINRGFAEAREYGTTTVCSMVAFPELMVRLPAPPIRTWWFYEMIDIRHRVTSEEVVQGALSFFDEQPGGLARFGLNPHAPYTASLLLYRLARACARAQGSLLLTTHVSESREELEMFCEGQGSLYRFLEGLGRPMHDCGLDTPFGWLWRNGAIGPQWILAHVNALEASDFALLDSLDRADLPHVVHCPGSHAYFEHPPFPFHRLAGSGVNVCLGTDSLASCHSLSLLGEVRRFRGLHPGLSAEDLLGLVTLAPARALRHEGRLGCVRAGALADLIAIPYGGPEREAAEGVVAHEGPVRWMMVNGRVASPESP
jgi:cytosine/adenosine deaminase-related metal-dependent hydrolase